MAHLTLQEPAVAPIHVVLDFQPLPTQSIGRRQSSGKSRRLRRQQSVSVQDLSVSASWTAAFALLIGLDAGNVEESRAAPASARAIRSSRAEATDLFGNEGQAKLIVVGLR